MEDKILLYKSKLIHYQVVGRGAPLILIHGYLADNRIWKKIIPLLVSDFKLILIDLPGHGKSGTITSINSMDFLAEIIYKLCLSLGLKSLRIAGHSMGGYVAMAFAEKYPEMIESMFLMSIHPFADNMTRTLARNREAEIIESGKKHLLLVNFIDKNFFSENLQDLKSEISEVSKVSLEQPESGMLADLAGMMVRPDRNHVIKNTRYPVYLIVGENDGKIPLDKFESIEGKNIVIHQMAGCGHFSMIEKSKQTAEIILNDLKKEC
jgi:pimeloyl-ACP methyl ester carboxylesterase